jgi:hypothetical protein
MRRSIHGVQVGVTGELPAALLEDLLAGFPEGDPSAAPRLTIDLRPASGPPPAGGRAMFFHGVVQASEDQGAIVLSDGASFARVAPDGSRVDLRVSPASLADRHTLEHVLALIALVLALRQHGLFHLHSAALVGPDGRAVLVAGNSGSGKSTLAVALLEHGLGYLGDDSAFLAARPHGVAVLSFPRPFHLSDATARAFPRLVPLLGDRYATGEKRRLDPHRAFPGREGVEAAAPAAVLLPEVCAQARTELEPVPPAVALGALIESSALVAVDAMPAVDAHLALLGAAVSGARCLRVRLGADLLAAPAAIVPAIVAATQG